MSNKYRNLTFHLASVEGNDWTASFDEIEEVLGFPLPDSARQYQAWWSNQMRSQSLGWQLAGWKATGLDLKNERVTFVYVGDENPSVSVEAQGLTIQQAKDGLASTFGVDSSQVEITIRA